MKYGEMASIQLCHYSGLVDVISAALGGKKKDDKSSLLPSTGSLEGDVAQIKSLLRVA